MIATLRISERVFTIPMVRYRGASFFGLVARMNAGWYSCRTRKELLVSDQEKHIKDEELDKVSGGRLVGDPMVREVPPIEIRQEPHHIPVDPPHLRRHE